MRDSSFQMQTLYKFDFRSVFAFASHILKPDLCFICKEMLKNMWYFQVFKITEEWWIFQHSFCITQFIKGILKLDNFWFGVKSTLWSPLQLSQSFESNTWGTDFSLSFDRCWSKNIAQIRVLRPFKIFYLLHNFIYSFSLPWQLSLYSSCPSDRFFHRVENLLAGTESSERAQPVPKPQRNQETQPWSLRIAFLLFSHNPCSCSFLAPLGFFIRTSVTFLPSFHSFHCSELPRYPN